MRGKRKQHTYTNATDPSEFETDFDALASRALSRRDVLGGGAAFGLSALVLGAAGRPALASSRLDFAPIAANGLDTVSVPNGYTWRPLASWGDPLWSDGAPFDHATHGTAASQARAFGDNTDGMALFSNAGRYLLAVNNEYTNLGVMFANRAGNKPESADDVRKGMAAHGVSIF